MSIVNLFEKGKFGDFRKSAKETLGSKREERVSEMRKEIAKPLIAMREKIVEKLTESMCYVYRTDSDGVVAVGDCYDMGKFKDAASAEEALKSMKDAVRRNERLYTAGHYYYHILPARDAEKLAAMPKEDEDDETEIDVGERDGDEEEIYGDASDIGDMSEATDVYNQIVSISKGKSGSITFADGDQSTLTTESAKQILKSVGSKGTDKEKTISGLSKSYESFMKTLNNIVTESYVVEISRKNK